MYSVSMLHTNGSWTVSRYFRTLKAATNWAKWLASHSYVREAAIHRGGPGGEKIEV